MNEIDAINEAMNILMPHIRVHTVAYPEYDDIVEGRLEEKTIEKHERQTN